MFMIPRLGCKLACSHAYDFKPDWLALMSVIGAPVRSTQLVIIKGSAFGSSQFIICLRNQGKKRCQLGALSRAEVLRNRDSSEITDAHHRTYKDWSQQKGFHGKDKKKAGGADWDSRKGLERQTRLTGRIRKGPERKKLAAESPIFDSKRPTHKKYLQK